MPNTPQALALNKPHAIFCNNGALLYWCKYVTRPWWVKCKNYMYILSSWIWCRAASPCSVSAVFSAIKPWKNVIMPHSLILKPNQSVFCCTHHLKRSFYYTNHWCNLLGVLSGVLGVLLCQYLPLHILINQQNHMDWQFWIYVYRS